jgi:hypothetical protein
VFAGSEPLGTGHGPSKQEAEQDAARAALESLTGSAIKPEKPARSRRAPRKKAQPAAPVVALVETPPAEVVPLPEPRSRQFGEPIE